MNSPEQTFPSECSRAQIEFSPGGSSVHYVPNYNSILKPFEGQKFQSLEDGIKFYKVYGAECGFTVRRGPAKKSSNGTVIRRYLYCHRDGRKNAKCMQGDSEIVKVKRRRVSNRVDCKARLVFRYSATYDYVVDEFGENHSHNMVSQSYKPFMKVNRNLDFAHQNFIVNCARANIGPIKSYRLFKEAVGSYSNVGCTGVEFKNFSRDLRAYVDGVDAQLLLDKLFNRREVCSAFTFDYCVDEHDKLICLFWADPMYNMVFAPFIGKDNHCKIVTFGAGLIHREDNHCKIVTFDAGLKEKFEGGKDKQSILSNKQKIFDQFYGSSLLNDVSVLPPNPVKTKGSGSRLKSRKEAAIKKMSKPSRTCRSEVQRSGTP